MSSGKPRFGALLASSRRQRGMSLAELAAATYVSRGWINNVEASRRWPPREWVEQVERVLGSNASLLQAWDRGECVRAANQELRDLLRQSERESKLLLAIEPDAVDLDGLNDAVVDLAVAYLASPALPMLKQGVALRQELTRRLKLGATRPRELADLFIALGRVSGVLAYAALDLGDPSAAMVHGETSWRMGDMAGDNALRAWSRGTQSLIARFGKRYDLGQKYIEDGLRFAGGGTSEVRLLCGGAQCAANVGDSETALALIDNAQRARDRAGPDKVEGLFGFSPAKQAYYSASSLMWLPDRSALETAANKAVTAINVWEQEPVGQRSLDDEALAHVYLATARLKLGDIDGAMTAVRPIIDLPPERQISWIRNRIGELANILDNDRFRNSAAAGDARDELRTYGAH